MVDGFNILDIVKIRAYGNDTKSFSPVPFRTALPYKDNTKTKLVKEGKNYEQYLQNKTWQMASPYP
jgi:hypothetical protein